MNRTTLNPTGISNGRPFHVHDEQAAKRQRILAAAPKLPVVERMRRSIAVMIEFYDQRRDFLQFYATEEPRLSEARNRIIEGSRERGANFFASLIEEGIRQGVFTR